VPPSSLRPEPVNRGRHDADPAPPELAWGQSRLCPTRKGAGQEGPSAPSWWTARATTGTVTPGFTKAEILKPPKENPLAEGGLFDRVGSLLEDLLR